MQGSFNGLYQKNLKPLNDMIIRGSIQFSFLWFEAFSPYAVLYQIFFLSNQGFIVRSRFHDLDSPYPKHSMRITLQD